LWASLIHLQPTEAVDEALAVQVTSQGLSSHNIEAQSSINRQPETDPPSTTIDPQLLANDAETSDNDVDNQADLSSIWPCQHCSSFRGRGSEEVKRHIKDDHPEKDFAKWWKCESKRCDEYFGSDRKLLAHSRLVHNVKDPVR